MSIKRNIKKILLLSLWLVIGGGVVALLVAGMNKKASQHCAAVAITINGAAGNNFLNQQDVLNIIAPDKNNPPQNRPINSFDLQALEKNLLQNQWVQTANLYFDNNRVLQVVVNEKEPIARIFTISGSSFYMDSSGRQVPLHENVSLKLPVFTNYPKEKLLRKGSDSVLIEDIKHLSNYIRSNEFWMAQIAQVDITTAKNFELMPVIGNHTIVFGSGNNYHDKFKRLLLFYQQVSAKLGFDKYSSINVQYNNQVVATKRGTISKIDSIQALKNVQRLIEASQHITVDSLLTSVDNNIMVTTPHDAPLSIAEERTNINPVKDSIQRVPTSSKPPVLKPQTNPSNIQERPRAVMPRRGT